MTNLTNTFVEKDGEIITIYTCSSLSGVLGGCSQQVKIRNVFGVCLRLACPLIITNNSRSGLRIPAMKEEKCIK